MDFQQLRQHIVKPTLQRLDLWTPPAENLLIGTCAVESAGKYVVQIGGGPALGLWQMEPATHDDIQENFLRFRPDLREKLLLLSVRLEAGELIGNINYACAMARLHYLRVKATIPQSLDGQAAYWKQYYNTPMGAGTVEKYIEAWHKYGATNGPAV